MPNVRELLTFAASETFNVNWVAPATVGVPPILPCAEILNNHRLKPVGL